MENFVAIDFETANYNNDSACSVGLVQVRKGQITRTEVHLLRPPSREFYFTHIHGLSWKDVATAPTFGEVWPKIEDIFEGAEFVAAHNAGFDERVLRACCERFGVRAPDLPFKCSMRLARNTWGIRPTRLSDVCRNLQIPLNHHEALSDALACAKIMLAAGLNQKPDSLGSSGLGSGPGQGPEMIQGALNLQGKSCRE